MDRSENQRLRRARDRALRLTGWFVPEEVRAQGESATTRALLLVLIAPLNIIATLTPGLAQLIDGQPTPMTLPLGLFSCGMFALSPFLIRWTRSTTFAGAWMLFSALVATFMVTYAQHGLDSILAVWLLLIPLSAGFFIGARWTVVFASLAGLGLTSFWVLEALGVARFSAVQALPEGPPFRWINLICALAVISALTVLWERAAEQARSEREELEAQIRRGQKLETVGMLAGGIAHDFNNILAAILGHASLLEQEVHEFPLQRRVQAIVDSSRRAAVLVEQMLAYAGRSRTRTGALDLPVLVREVVELVRPGLDRKTELILDLDAPTPKLAADPVQIQQIAMNLVTNASEALEGRPGRVWVQISTVDAEGLTFKRPATPNDFVMLEVRDEGCGIPPDKLESIFDPFFTTKPSGHGLGLAAVLGIVRSHGGDIEVDSTVGEGTRFRVLLPCPNAEALAAAEPEDAPRPRIRLPTSTGFDSIRTGSGPHPSRRVTSPRNGKLGCVLIVDDEIMVRELASEVLEREGIEVLLGCDGADGYAVFEANAGEIDLVILDRTMPGLDGLELLAKLRQRRPDLPAIISSGYAEDPGSRSLRALGIDAVLHKPWAPSDLVEVVGELGVGRKGQDVPTRTPRSRV